MSEKRYKSSFRSGINKRVSTKEKEKFLEMSKYENALREKGLTYIAGIDEVGRGPLAGPVVTAAVVLPKDFIFQG